MLLRTLLVFLYFSTIISSSGAQINSFSTKKYTVEELQEDFNYMRTQIQSKGTVIYLYNTKKETDQYFDSLYQCIKEPMTDIEFFRFVAPVQAFIKDVHTSITPGSTIRSSFFGNQNLFPLYVELIDQKTFVEQNLSGNPALNEHPEIISINGIPMETIIQTCSLVLPREGYDTGHPLFWLNGDFSYYYYFVYGPSESYRLELKTKEGLKQTETLQGMSLEAIWEIDDQLNPAEAAETRNVYTKVNDSLKTVILTINSFDDNDIKENHKTSFRKLIRAEFDTILKTGYSNLIIDVRDNDGGNSGDGKKVLKYLLDSPFKIKQSVQVVKNKNEEDLMKRNRTAFYGQFQRGTYKPHKNRFDGDVYVLGNGGSTSAAVVFAATLDRHNRATFVGIEMGGNPIVMGGGLWDYVKNTPNTNISFSFGNKLNILDNIELNTGHGLIPDYVVEESYADFIAGKDSQLLFTLKLISGSGNSADNVTADPDKSGCTKPALEGQWKFVSAEKVENTPFLNQYPDPEIFPDEAPLPQFPYTGPDLMFEKDSMYELNYPEYISNRMPFSVDSGYLVSTYRIRLHPDPRPLELANDTLYIYQPYHGRQYIKEVYVKTSFNDSIVAILKEQGVNYPELAGTWFLVRQDSGEDGSEYILEFPHQLPDSIVVTRKDFITALEKNRVYLMSTDGKKRDYTFSYEWGYLRFTPGEWYKGEDPWIHFSRTQMEN